MEKKLTYESVLELMERQSRMFIKNLDEGIEKSRKEFEKKLERERIAREKRLEQERREREAEREKSRKEFEKELRKSRREFNKRMGELAGTWGKFVSEMVQPKIVELFQKRGIETRTTLQHAKGFKNNQIYYEIDLLVINTNSAVVVEVKSTLKPEDVDEHLERIEKIKEIAPHRINLSGATLYGAVAGMIVENHADRYAYKNGLYVLRQKGDIVEIANDENFQPAQWHVDY